MRYRERALVVAQCTRHLISISRHCIPIQHRTIVISCGKVPLSYLTLIWARPCISKLTRAVAQQGPIWRHYNMLLVRRRQFWRCRVPESDHGRSERQCTDRFAECLVRRELAENAHAAAQRYAGAVSAPCVVGMWEFNECQLHSNRIFLAATMTISSFFSLCFHICCADIRSVILPRLGRIRAKLAGAQHSPHGVDATHWLVGAEFRAVLDAAERTRSQVHVVVKNNTYVFANRTVIGLPLRVCYS
jgi:hypothetical protein